MDLLWRESDALTVREIRRELSGGRDRAYTTVMTVLDRLYRKGFVHRERDGRAYRYRAAQSRVEHTATLMGDLLTEGGDLQATWLHFIDQISPEDADRLRESLKRLDDGQA